MADKGQRLGEGSRVGVVGGGPAGSFFAIHLLSLAREQGFAPAVDIYEPKDFSRAGPPGCNRCAGILSASLVENMKALGLEPPPVVVQGRIHTYSLHSPFGTIEVENPSPAREILSVYRGAGPRISTLPPAVSFDAFLLGEARKAGARVIAHRVEEVRLRPSPAVLVGGGWLGYDLVVLAIGVNSPRLPVEGIAYRRPTMHRMSQDELVARPEDIAQAFGTRVRVFLLPHSDLVFGTLVPKGSFVNVSLLGTRHLPSVADFLEHPLVRKALPFPYTRVCGCRSFISLGRARNPVAPGFVAIGDAGVTRLYKDGIGAALLTSRQAAHVAVHHGVSAEALSRRYLPFLRSLHRDNRLGRAIFAVHHRLKDSPSFFRAHGRLADAERERGGKRSFHRVFWGLFTGSYSYRSILGTSLSPTVVTKLVVEAARQRLKGYTLPPTRIVILGGGFGGVYTTLHLGKALRKHRAVNITLVSQENFFLFTPLLHEVATGGIETRHIAQPIRGLQKGRRFSFTQAQVERVDLEGKVVHTSRGPIAYDSLVLALGAVPDTSRIQGSAPYLFFLKNLYDGLLLRNHIIGLFEEAAAQGKEKAGRLTFTVVGGGGTGVQLIAEIRDFVTRFILRNYPVPSSQVHFLLIQDEDRLLEDMDPRLARYALATLHKKGVEVRLGSRVTRLLPQEVEINGQEVVPTGTLVWTGGIKASPVVEGLPLAKDDRGRIRVDQHLEVAGYPGVYALGDNASFVDARTGRSLPARAHIAVRQPRTVARNIVADLTGGRKRAFKPPWTAELVALGSHRAAAKLSFIRLYGLPARVLWLTGYLLLVPSRYTRTRVALDWLLALIFGRDLTHLRLPRSGP